MKSYIYLGIVLFLIAACRPKTIPMETTLVENRDLDTLTISAPKPDNLKTPEEFKLPQYNPTAKREHDLLHTKLDVRFDWAKQHVIGKATLELKPHFYATQWLRLDAKNFDIKSVSNPESGAELTYNYDNQILTIDLGKTYSRKDKFKVLIDYVAKPAERESMGGSTAITSDQGLFFINHDGSDPSKPMQIWTQGETEHNSRWFPTIDKPNERCTQELYVTVEDKYKTLSNGILQSSTQNVDGTRTDYWKMDLPHAPYLFMLGVGEFAVVTDKWNDIVVDYYVEKEYENDARAIFAHTPEMLDFFSSKTGVPYPWPKYSQIVVRDYVSGAMENTSAVIFGEFVQRHQDELIDDNNDKIVAHEMFHHWFGDLVTCESWANLTLNEGFANYSEYLWLEHKYGRAEADYHRLSELNGYLGEARQKRHPLIHFGYDDKEDMFDAHSYNKGGLVLHMLRYEIGEDAFWAGLNKYLTDNQYSDVEVDELRMAFEDVTGQDLNWFFDQWYLAAGHPELSIQTAYDADNKQVEIIVEQVQNTDQQPAIFELPFAIDVYDDTGKSTRHDVRMTKRKQTFLLACGQKPALINIDADNTLLCEKNENKSESEYIFQYRNAPLFMDRYVAVMRLKDSSSSEAKAIIEEAIKDDFWAIRGIASSQLPTNAKTLPVFAKIAANDTHKEVRAVALEKIAESGNKKYISTLTQSLENDPTAYVKATALVALTAIDMEKAEYYAQRFEKTQSSDMLTAVSEIYAVSGEASKMPFFEQNAARIDGYEALSYMDNYLYLAMNTEEASVGRALSFLKEVAMDAGHSPWRRFGATKAIADLRSEYKAAMEGADDIERRRYDQKVLNLESIINQIKSTEKNKQLLDIYEQY